VGMIQLEETHVNRSSSIADVKRWLRENVRLITVITIAVSVLMFMFIVLLYGIEFKSVSIVLNGQKTTVVTRQADLKHLLNEQSIVIDAHDRISTPLNAMLKNGEQINIETTSPILLTADGATRTLYTTGKTVGSALDDLHISLGGNDKVFPSLSSAVADDAMIKVVRVKKEIEAVTLNIPFKTEQKKDKSLLKGKQKLIQQGIQGVKLIAKQKVYEDGVLVSDLVLNESVQTASTDEIIAVGTKNPVVALSISSDEPKTASKAGINFDYKKIINDVTLTAYTEDYASTGKKPGDRGFGITYTGTTVQAGRTIAVDRNVIPLGWWVYIDGIGFRRAEDTGSAIIGNRIDVYYSNEDQTNQFGLKRGYTVYVIGPNKPDSN